MKSYDIKRQQIKEAGIKSFAAYGYQKTTLEDIANMLGMKKNSLYYYFESKEALFREIIEDEVKEHVKALEDVSVRNLSADKKLKKAIRGLFDFIRERTLNYAVKLSSYLEISRVINNEFKEFRGQECSFIQEILNEGIKSGVFKKHNTKVLAEDIQYLIPAIIYNEYSNSGVEFVHEVDFNKIENRVDRFITYIINGIKNK